MIMDHGRRAGRPIDVVVQELVDAELGRACKTTGDALIGVENHGGITALLLTR